MIRRALRILLALVVAGLFLLSGLGIALHLGGARWAVNRLLRKVNPYAGTSLVVGSVHGNLLRDAELRDVEFRDASGEVAARASRISGRYSLTRLLRGEIVIDQVTLSGGSSG